MGTRAWLGSLNFSAPYGLYPYRSLWSMPKACMQIVAKDCWLPPSNRNTNTGSPSSCECLSWWHSLNQGHVRERIALPTPAFPSIPDSHQTTHFEPGTLVLLLHWPWQITIGLLKLEGLIKGHCSTSNHPIQSIPCLPLKAAMLLCFLWL